MAQRDFLSGLGISLTCFLWASLGWAEPLPLKSRVLAGSPAHEVDVQINGGETPTLEVGGKRHPLGLSTAQSATIENVRVSDKAAVNVVRIDGSEGQAVMVLGGSSGGDVLFSGRADLHGDPGERTQAVVAVSGANEQGARTVSVGTRHEAVSLCGQRVVLFGRATVDPRTLTLTKREPVATSLPSAIIDVTASPTTAAKRSLVSALRASGSSETPAAGALAPERPTAVVDDNPDTAWLFAPPRANSFFVFRWERPTFPIESLSFVAPRAPATLPSTLLVLTDSDSALRVTFPAPARGVFEVPLPSPVTTTCLAVLLETAPEAKKPVGIAELSALVDVDREGGIDRLVALLVQNDPRADTAASALSELGPKAAERVASRFEELDLRGKRRALRVLGKHVTVAASKERLLSAVRANDETSDPALTVIKNSGDEGRELLRALAQDATARGDEAASTLARARGESIALLRALAAQGGSERPALRRSLATAARRDATEFEAALDTWLQENPSLSARVTLALVLANTGEHASRALSLALPVLNEASEFPDRYRLALALTHAAPSPEADAWLQRVATDAPEWMLRKAALGALLKRSPQEGQAVAQSLVRDPYPRVRASAVAALNASVAKAQVEAAARKDVWPVVREAAVRSLSETNSSRDTLRAALDDKSRRVRAAAIDGLTKTRDADAWPLVLERLRAVGEWPEVHAAAMRFAAALCVAEAREPVTYFLRTSLKPDATEEEALLGAVAFETLSALGGQAEADAKVLAGRDTAPAAVRRAAKSPPATSCAAKPSPAPPTAAKAK